MTPHHLNDTCPEDRLNPRLVDAWEAEKRSARRAWLRELAGALAFAALVIGALKLAGAL